MGLLDDLTPHVKKYSCKIATILNDLDETDRAILEAAIADANTWTARALANALRQRGVLVVDVSITKHRNGICSC